MEQFKVKIFQNGPIATVQVIDGKEVLDVAAGEGLEYVAGQAISKMVSRRLKKHPALELLEELVETADLDKVYDKAEKLLKELGE